MEHSRTVHCCTMCVRVPQLDLTLTPFGGSLVSLIPFCRQAHISTAELISTTPFCPNQAAGQSCTWVNLFAAEWPHMQVDHIAQL
jgi:hypothetical protein